MLNPIVTAELAREHAHLLQREAEAARRQSGGNHMGTEGVLAPRTGLGRAVVALRSALAKQMPALTS